MNKQQLSHLFHIQEASKHNRLVAFVGAGVSKNSGIPLWSELISAMKQELPDSLQHETDDLKIAQLYKDSRGHKEYMDKVKEVLMYNKAIPNDIHRAILDLNPNHIITTNYDDLLEQEIQNEFKQFAVIRENKDMSHMSYPNTLIKMHGDYDSDNIVLTEEDYYNYSKNFSLIRSYVLSLFASKLVVFIGFSLEDLNLKMILNELKGILSDNMQRAYLISNDEPDEVTSKYYENKGINIIYFSESNANKLDGLCTGKPIFQNTLTDNRGKKLCKILESITYLRRDYEIDFVESIYNKILSYKDEIKVFGEGLKYLFPKHLYSCWNYYSDGLQLNSPYFESLYKELKTYKGRKKFLKDHSRLNIIELKRMAYYNHLYYIDSIKIIDDGFLKNYNRHFEESATTYLYDFDLRLLNNRLRQLSTKKLQCNIEDLEYPFLLYQLGDYYGAYKQYSQILPLAWRRQKYILYFICLYNMWAIRFGIVNQYIFSETIDCNAILQKIESVNLEEVLSRLPIDDEIRKILQNLLSFRFISDQSVETEKLKEKLHQQCESAKRGGSSINSNLISLLAKYKREFNFCNNNFIICDNNKFYKSICKNTIIGILNSFATPEVSFGKFPMKASKLDKIDTISVFIMIFSIDTKELSEIFDQYGINQLEISDAAVELINGYLSNLAIEGQNPYVNRNIFINYIGNLLFIISRIKDDSIDSLSLYNVILKFGHDLVNNSILERVLLGVLYNYPPKKEYADKLLYNLIYKSDRIERFSNTINFISRLYKNNGTVFDNFNVETLKKGQGDFLYPLYEVIPEIKKSEFEQYCVENMHFLGCYLDFINRNRLLIRAEKNFKDLLDKHFPIDENSKTYCYKLLAQLRKSDDYSNVTSIIDEYAKDKKCMQFFFNPFDYESIQEVKTEWILECPDEIIVELLKKEPYRIKIKDYLSSSKNNTTEQKRLITLL